MSSKTPLSVRIMEYFAKLEAQGARSPSVRQVKDALDVSSMQVLHETLKALAEEELLEPPAKRQHRGWRMTDTGRRLLEQWNAIVERRVMRFHLGRVRAGHMLKEWQELFAQTSEHLFFGDDDNDTIEVSLSLLPSSPENLFALRVAGDSMEEALINDGDIVIVKKRLPGENIRNGAMVVAYDMANDGVTLKHYHEERDFVELKPANAAYQPIRAAKEHLMCWARCRWCCGGRRRWRHKPSP
ncbi:MAG: hypothetical protein IPK16_12940 [Anaerolineales bacterium]|nr:hypothetical protein [Anaerolineales bacterium]